MKIYKSINWLFFVEEFTNGQIYMFITNFYKKEKWIWIFFEWKILNLLKNFSALWILMKNSRKIIRQDLFYYLKYVGLNNKNTKKMSKCSLMS